MMNTGKGGLGYDVTVKDLTPNQDEIERGYLETCIPRPPLRT